LTNEFLKLLLDEVVIYKFEYTKALTDGDDAIDIFKYTFFQLCQLCLEKERQLIQTLL